MTRTPRAHPGSDSRLLTGILCTYRRPELAAAYLDRLREQTRTPDVVVLVDNGSDPQLRSLCEARSDDRMTVVYVDPGRNIGPAGAFHAGVVELADTVGPDDVIVHFDDNDLPVRPDQLERLAGLVAELAAADGRIGGVALSGGHLSRWTGVVHGPIGDSSVEDVDHLHGWSLPAYRARALLDVGGNDPSFFYGFEELELGRRLRRRGWRLLADNDLMTQLLPRYPRRSSLRLGRMHIASDDIGWSRFYKERNLIRVLRRENHWVAIAVTVLGRHVGKPLLALPRQPGAARHRLVLGLQATVAGLRGAGGIDPRYPPS